MNIEKNIFVIALTVCVLCSLNLNAQQGVVEVNQDKQIDKLLELKKDINRRGTNFKIQIYNGSRGGAENARREFYKSFSGWPISLEYETPNYKIWVGNFQTRLEADRALLRIKKKFANAFIFRPKTN
ncbi:MAG: SPOR domain-containing protein [Flavobacteriaceae bacterium]|nr:SPOR domain-containing protein [Bacteroidia bacterium]MBT8286984.1 SPOR domain-containing protein [Bacteroidia bacterium]NNF75047.1 SPOR domain-containing protein [Flavobacteriaceae bacterium]NNK73424.1 SPOR domain-containing protein [Flavobacteriaceae bacterium]